MLWLGSLPRCGDMQTVILCGGTGVRAMPSTLEGSLEAFTAGRRPSGSRPRVMEIYADQNFTDFVLAAGYKAELVWKSSRSPCLRVGTSRWSIRARRYRNCWYRCPGLGCLRDAKSSGSRFWPTQDGVIANWVRWGEWL